MSTPKPKHPLIERAIQVVGRQADLADAAGVVQQTISKALHCEIAVSAELAVAIDRATNGAVPRHALRPDIFDPPAEAPREPAEAAP